MDWPWSVSSETQGSFMTFTVPFLYVTSYFSGLWADNPPPPSHPLQAISSFYLEFILGSLPLLSQCKQPY